MPTPSPSNDGPTELRSSPRPPAGEPATQGPADEWVNLTLLNLAFDRGDASEAARLVDVIQRDNPAGWKSETMLDDLRLSFDLLGPSAQHDLRPQLHAVEAYVAAALGG